MTQKFPTRPKVADGQRHNRFVAMTQQITALDDAKSFEKAFQEAFKNALANAAGARRIAGHRTNGA
jgi:hypothetical protein